MSLYILAGNLSGQSAASVLHPQQTLHPPGNIPETGQNQLLQPLKPSPSSDNLYSAFTSDGAISVPSLSAPGQGKKSKQPSPSRNINMEVGYCHVRDKSLTSHLLLRWVGADQLTRTQPVCCTFKALWAERRSWVMVRVGALVSPFR